MRNVYCYLEKIVQYEDFSYNSSSSPQSNSNNLGEFFWIHFNSKFKYEKYQQYKSYFLKKICGRRYYGYGLHAAV